MKTHRISTVQVDVPRIESVKGRQRSVVVRRLGRDLFPSSLGTQRFRSVVKREKYYKYGIVVTRVYTCGN